MPFGLTCAPSVFQRLMDVVLCGLSYHECLVYLDDIIVFGKTFDEQLTRLGDVFDRLRTTNLKLKPSKCFLCQRSVEFLGHVVSEEGLAMQPSKVEAIDKWTTCRDVSEVRAFMGISGYYRRFIKDFSTIAAPLYDLTRKESEFRWTPECQDAFEELKRRLMREPVLALPSDNGTYVLDTDASDFGLGAVLSQRQGDQEKVIAYASRTLGKPEQKYETTRKELLAVVSGLKQFRQYLLGRHFIIRTDHAALTWLRRTAEPMPQLARWLTFIEQFDYEIEHRPGARHGNADGLSRQVTREVRAVKQTQPSTTPPTLAERQRLDKETGAFVSLRLSQDRPPRKAEVQLESEVTKQLVNQWSKFELHDGLLYRRYTNTPQGEDDYLQLLLPREDIPDAIRQCHAGVTGGHFGEEKTKEQVKRRFYWPSWKGDVGRFCRQCTQCNRYHGEDCASKVHCSQSSRVHRMNDGTSTSPDRIPSLIEGISGY